MTRVAEQDAFIAERLRSAGAVILGKTNLSEWANIRASHSTSGWSGRGGQCRNPYALDRSPSGSSSGSAAAVAAVHPHARGDEPFLPGRAAWGLLFLKPLLGGAHQAFADKLQHRLQVLARGEQPVERAVTPWSWISILMLTPAIVILQLA